MSSPHPALTAALARLPRILPFAFSRRIGDGSAVIVDFSASAGSFRQVSAHLRYLLSQVEGGSQVQAELIAYEPPAHNRADMPPFLVLFLTTDSWWTRLGLWLSRPARRHQREEQLASLNALLGEVARQCPEFKPYADSAFLLLTGTLGNFPQRLAPDPVFGP